MLFDEFHERSLDADLGLALARDAQTGLREDLRILVMSATLDGARIAKMLGDAPVVASEGRAFAVETRYLGRKADLPLERQMADAVAMALRADPGSVLAFLRGAAEIRRTQTLLSERIHDAAIEIAPLFGALDAAVQDRAIAPAPRGRRKVVLATSIAETSLTIEGVRMSRTGCGTGAALRARIGLTRLETVRASPRRPTSAAAVRAAPKPASVTACGTSRKPHPPPHRPAGNPQRRPSPLALDLAQWGPGDPAHARIPRPAAGPGADGGAHPAARLGALDDAGRITAEGNSLRALALPPRLARMIVDLHRPGLARLPPISLRCSPSAASAATASTSMSGSTSSAATARNAPAARAASPGAGRRRWLYSSISPLAGEGWGRGSHSGSPSSENPHPRSLPARGRGAERVLLSRETTKGAAELTTGVMLALAFPDRVARNRGQGSFVLANGRGAAVDAASALARTPYIAVAELTGTAAQGRILLAAPIAQADIEAHFADRIEIADEVSFDRGAMALRARRRRTLQAMTLSEAPACVDAIGGDRAGAGRRPDRCRHRTTAMVEIGQGSGATV